MLFAFFGFGLFTAMMANFPFPETFRNSPYVITYVTGIMSLMCIFSVTLLAAQSLLRERDSQFDLILYATPVKKIHYLSSRFIIIFIVATLSFALFVAGLLTGHQLFQAHKDEFTHLRVWYYVQPFLVLAVPNILFCTAVICSIGAVSGNKMVIYISGLFIYFLYWGISLFTNSPLMAGASPVSADSMQLMAKVDPFGMAAFFEQTQYWTAAQRNTGLPELKGNFLFNRVLYITVSVVLILFAYYQFGFAIKTNKRMQRPPSSSKPAPGLDYSPVTTKTTGMGYALSTWRSFVKLDMRSIGKSIPLWLIILGWIFFFSMEMVGEISGGTRLPPRFATSALMITHILELFPIVGLLVILFYGSEIFWRSQGVRFASLENSNPVPPAVLLLSKWCTLSIIPVLLIVCSILTGVGFQLALGYTDINWSLYLSLFYLVGLPLSLCAALIIAIQAFCKNKYLGLIISSLLLLLTNTSLGGMMGLHHPLLRYANAYQGDYSEMNGFDLFLNAFHMKMLYWFFVSAVVFFIAIRSWNRNKKTMFAAKNTFKISQGIVLATCLAGAVWTGYIINKETAIPKKGERNNWKQAYEERYKKFKQLLQPTVTDIKTTIDLFPGNNSYTVAGTYTMINKGTVPIDSVLVYADKAMQWQHINVANARLLEKDALFGHYWYKLNTPLQPGDSARMEFRFSYHASAYNGFATFSAILKNGAFMRISNFFPGFGYIADHEIDDPKERSRRKMPVSAGLKPLEEKATTPYDYGYINLDAVISTEKEQTAIGIGELSASWSKDDRNYFHYTTPSPVPFRFVVASARYAIRKIKQRDISIEVYYQPGHDQNIDRLIRDAKQALDYCEQNFGPYPYRVIRFAEISSFTKGFAGTAYPTALFINESFGYQNKIEASPDKDVLNEMVSHELSHAWWGNAAIDPEYREGSKLLTETLAMYTELMLYKKAYGEENIVNRVAVHRDIYLSERAQAGEDPLYRADPIKPFLSYDKGMVVMYQLYRILGEEKINEALKNFLRKYAWPNQPPVATDLLRELYAVSDTVVHEKIDELFQQIITYNVQLTKVSCTGNGKGYDLAARFTIKKYREDGKGKKEELPFNGPLEMGLYFKDGRSQIVTVNGNSAGLVLPEKPVKVILDPRLLLLNVNTENKEKVIE